MLPSFALAFVPSPVGPQVVYNHLLIIVYSILSIHVYAEEFAQLQGLEHSSP